MLISVRFAQGRPFARHSEHREESRPGTEGLTRFLSTFGFAQGKLSSVSFRAQRGTCFWAQDDEVARGVFSSLSDDYSSVRSYLQLSFQQWRVDSPVFLLDFSSRMGEPQSGQGSATGFPHTVNLQSGYRVQP